MAVTTARVGEILVDRGLITPEQLDAALARQAREGGLIGRHLVIDGAVTRREMYGALAEQWDAPLIDLVEEPPEGVVLAGIGAPNLVEAGWVPWRVLPDGTGVIATSVPPTDDVLATARALMGV